MKYMLLIYTDENAWTDSEREHCFVESTQLTHVLNAQGKFLGASPLHPVATATSVRVRNDKRLVTDGPFAETREQLGGYFLIEAEHLDEAIDIAGRIPARGKGPWKSGRCSNSADCPRHCPKCRSARHWNRERSLEPTTAPIQERTNVIANNRRLPMKVMVLVKATEASEAGKMPSRQLLEDMMKYNAELVKAGIMTGGDGLQPSCKGVRVHFSGSNRTVIDGPFAETKELVAGYWLWQVKSMEEAIAWVKRCPNPMTEDSDIEIRPMFEVEDFGESATPELRQQEEQLRASLSRTGLQPPRFENGPERVIAGYNASYTFESRVNIPSQWLRFAPHIGKVPTQVGQASYGVCWNYKPGYGFDYLSGVEVRETTTFRPTSRTSGCRPANTRSSRISTTCRRLPKRSTPSGGNGSPARASNRPTGRASSATPKPSTRRREQAASRSGFRSKPNAPYC